MNRPTVEQYTARKSSRLWTAAALAFFVAVLAAMSWRLYEHRSLGGPATLDRWALGSYRDAIYYPLIAIGEGVNPYDSVRNGDPNRYMQRYPVLDTLPLYSPLLLGVFAPLALLPYGASCIVFTAINVLLFLVLAWLILRAVGKQPSIAAVCIVGALILASQPGRGAFNAGQVAVPLAIAGLLALQWGDRRPWLAGSMVAFLTLKPTLGGPLGLMLASRRDWRSVFGGFAAGAILCLAGFIFICARSGDLSLERMVNVLGRNHTDFTVDPMMLPENNKGRVDLPAAMEYLVGRRLPLWANPLTAAAVLAITGWVLWRSSRNGAQAGCTSTGSALAVLAMYVCFYHHVYDLPLLALPIAAGLTQAHRSWRLLAPWVRWLIVALMIVPFVNMFWTDGFRLLLERIGLAWGESGSSATTVLYRFCCVANGFALTAAWAILLVSLSRTRKEERFDFVSAAIRPAPQSDRRTTVEVA